ncbi:Lactosylceramide 4-alpha-galactosyltransferase [Chamberlinius hualienensis]
MSTKIVFKSILKYGFAFLVLVTIVQWIETQNKVSTSIQPQILASIQISNETSTENVKYIIKHEPIDISGLFKFEAGQPIHLVETEVGKGHLTPREACVIESAARHHPHSIVTLYTINRYFNWNDPYRNILETFFNVRIVPLNVTELFDGTPLLECDAVRYVILYKHGGIYLDTDSVVVQTLQNLKNTIALEVNDVLAISVLIFDKGHHYMINCIYDYAMNYNATSRGYNGPRLVTRVLKRMCNVNNSFLSVLNKPEMCQGVNIFPRKAFYFFHWDDLFRGKKTL